MPRIKLFLMRHSKSCSNHTRTAALDHDDPEDPAVIVSQAIRDPGLSVVGYRNAEAYGPVLKAKLRSSGRFGFDVDRAIIAASTLRRAQDTARLVFGARPIALGHFAENGELPENTPAKGAYTAPDWDRFLGHLSNLVKDKDGASVVVVGHGSYLKSLWPRLTGDARRDRLNNMDGILLDIDVSPKGCHVHSFKEIPYTGASFTSGTDQCKMPDRHKIAAIHKGMVRKQRGGNGSMGMPLTYFTGNQPQDCFSDATGKGLVGQNDNWIRAPLRQSGGRSRSREGGFGVRAKRTRRNSRLQNGGFSAEIMGAFAANGARLLPIATYMGYKMYSNQKKGRKTVKKGVRRSRRN